MWFDGRRIAWNQEADTQDDQNAHCPFFGRSNGKFQIAPPRKLVCRSWNSPFLHGVYKLFHGQESVAVRIGLVKGIGGNSFLLVDDVTYRDVASLTAAQITADGQIDPR